MGLDRQWANGRRIISQVLDEVFFVHFVLLVSVRNFRGRMKGPVLGLVVDVNVGAMWSVKSRRGEVEVGLASLFDQLKRSEQCLPHLNSRLTEHYDYHSSRRSTSGD